MTSSRGIVEETRFRRREAQRTGARFPSIVPVSLSTRFRVECPCPSGMLLKGD
jgi:hypothetical protein